MMRGLPPRDQLAKGRLRGNKPPGKGESPQDQPPSEPNQEEITEIVDSEEDDLTILEPHWPKAGSDTWRTGVHTCHLPRSGQQERKRRACLNGKWLCLEG